MGAFLLFLSGMNYDGRYGIFEADRVWHHQKSLWITHVSFRYSLHYFPMYNYDILRSLELCLRLYRLDCYDTRHKLVA